MLKRLVIWLIKWGLVLALLAAAVVAVYALIGDFSAPVTDIEQPVTVDVE